jgi:hypothetical protein
LVQFIWKWVKGKWEAFQVQDRHYKLMFVGLHRFFLKLCFPWQWMEKHRYRLTFQCVFQRWSKQGFGPNPKFNSHFAPSLTFWKGIPFSNWIESTEHPNQ